MRVESNQPPISTATMLTEASADRMAESALDLAMDIVVRTDVVVAQSATETIDLYSVASRLGAITDPQAILFLMQSQVRDTDAEMSRELSHFGENKAKLAHEKRMEELKKAERAARKSKRPKFLKKFLKIFIAVISTVAAVFTGGAALGLAIAGMVLMFAGEHIVKGLVKLGLVPEKAAVWLTLALAVAGSALMGGAGLAAGAQASSAVAQGVAQLVGTAAETLVSTTQLAAYIANVIKAVADVVVDTRAAIWGKRAVNFEMSAAEAKIDQEAAEALGRDALDSFKEAFERFSRVSERLLNMAEANGRLRTASTQLLA